MAEDPLGLDVEALPLIQLHPDIPILVRLPVVPNSGAMTGSPTESPTESTTGGQEATLPTGKSRGFRETQPRARRQRTPQAVTKTLVIFEDPDMIRAVHAAEGEARCGANEGDENAGKTNPQSTSCGQASPKMPSVYTVVGQSPFYSDSDVSPEGEGGPEPSTLLTYERLAVHKKLPENIPESTRTVRWMDRVTMPSIAADIFVFVDPSVADEPPTITSPFAAVVEKAIDPATPSKTGIRPPCHDNRSVGAGATEEEVQRSAATEEQNQSQSKEVGLGEQQSLQTIAAQLSQSIRTLSGSVKESPAVYGSMLSDLITALDNVVARYQDCKG